MTAAPSIARAISGALLAMREQSPGVYGTLRMHVHDAATMLSVDDETVPLTSDGSRIDLDCRDAEFRVWVSTDRETLLDLAAARVDLVDAIVADRVVVVGDVASLVAAEHGLAAFLCWAIRSPAARSLFQQYADDGRRGHHG